MVRVTDHPDMTITVYRGRKIARQVQQKHLERREIRLTSNMEDSMIRIQLHVKPRPWVACSLHVQSTELQIRGGIEDNSKISFLIS